MSLETTLARAAAREAEHAWKVHRTGCPTCIAAAKAHRFDRLCDRGFVAYDDRRLALAAVKESKLADARPIPGQGMLL